MNASAAVLSAFRRSNPFVERLESGSGPLERPEVPVVEEVSRTLWERQGKRLRSRLVYWFGELCGVPENELELYAWAAEAIHTASLLHDDVVDKAETRRGAPSANALFDNTLPVLSGDYLFSDAIHQVALGGHSELLTGLCRTVKNLATGECLQYQQRFQVPESEAIYARISELKTGSLLKWAGTVGPILRPVVPREAVERFLDGFGKVFQYSDDMLDVHGSSTKDRWSDLREGKLNWVTWHFVRRDVSLERSVKEAFGRREVPPVLVRAFSRAADRGADGEARAKLAALAERTVDALSAFPPGETTEALAGLVRLCLDRTL